MAEIFESGPFSPVPISFRKFRRSDWCEGHHPIATVSQPESCLPPHRPPSDLADLVLDTAASLRALIHRTGVRFDQEGRSGRGG
jgi:hypothetical protein